MKTIINQNSFEGRTLDFLTEYNVKYYFSCNSHKFIDK